MQKITDELIGRNITRAIKESGKSQKLVAVDSMLSEGGLINYAKGRRTPDIIDLEKIAHSCGKDVSWFLIDHDKYPQAWDIVEHNLQANEKQHVYEVKKIHGINEVEWIKLLGKVTAGFPDTSQGEFIGEIPIMKGSLPKNSFALKIRGDSMIPEFYDGNTIFFCADQLYPKSGEFVIAVDEFGGTMVKQFQFKDNEVWLVSLNPVYKPFKANEHFKILGTVVGKYNFEKY